MHKVSTPLEHLQETKTIDLEIDEVVATPCNRRARHTIETITPKVPKKKSNKYASIHVKSRT